MTLERGQEGSEGMERGQGGPGSPPSPPGTTQSCPVWTWSGEGIRCEARMCSQLGWGLLMCP